MKIKNPENSMELVVPDNLLEQVMKQKNKGRRLSQICSAYANEKLELSYSFADDTTNEYHTLRLVIDKETEVYSITEFYPYAFLYENEMKELFGVNVKMINLDYNNKLYRIEEEAPFLKK
ncbi:MAG: NADH-quinone oxidoreductase subunit C [Lachnospiraceae bacterium]|nr:NADH-quinone oxidoreductase subunit C [Lachnospiraceae bacterium]